MENKIYVNGKSVIIPQCLINKKKGKVSSEIQMTSENLCVPVVISGCKGYIINNTNINELKKLFGRSLYNTYFLNGTYIYKKKDYPTKILPAYKHKFNYVFMTKDSLVDVNSKQLENILIYAGINLEDNEHKFLFTNDLSKAKAIKISELHNFYNGDMNTIFEKVRIL